MHTPMDELIKEGRLLLVDDDVSSLCLLENVLQRLGFRYIRTLAKSPDILTELEDFRPDLVVTDLGMPVLDGIGLIRAVRGHRPEDATLPILVLTGNIQSLARQDALRVGATDILFKPLDACEMLMRVRNLLRAHFLQRQIQSHNRLLEESVAARTAELRQALTDLQESRHQVVQQERLRAFGAMAGGVVHDFNNALMSVIGYSELLLNDENLLEDRVTTRQYLETINTAGLDASHVISRLRDFYRPKEPGDIFEPTNLNVLIEETIPLTRPKWHDHALESGRDIKVELELRKVPMVAANPSELREVITNMIFNAVDAMPEGGTITIRTTCVDDGVRVEIADTGIGMSEEVRRRCTEPFFTTKGEHGTGLGLSMCFGILRRHDGKLEIDSLEGIGTTMRIEFPAAQQANAGLANTVPLGKGLRVLVVDDDPVSRDVVTRYLRADGHEVTAASSGEEALGRLRDTAFDLLITDQGMPGMSGLVLAEHARSLYPSMPVILVTGFGPSAEQEVAAISAVLRKPLTRDLLRNTLQEAFPDEPPPTPSRHSADLVEMHTSAC